MIELVGNYFDANLANYSSLVSATLIGIVWPIFLAAVSVWVLFHGYTVVVGTASESAVEFVWRAMKVVMIAGVISPSAARYSPWFSANINELATSIAGLFLPSDLGVSGSPTAWTYVQAIDDKIEHLGVAIQQDAGFGGFLPRLDLLIAWIMCSVGMAIFEGVVTFVLLLAKSVLAFYIAIGPIFIACLLFRPTARLFESWVSAVLSAIVLTWLSFFICGLTMHVAGSMVTATMNQTGLLQATVNLFSQSVTFLSMCCVLALIAWQGPQIAAGLTGGTALQQGHQLASLVYRILRNRNGGPAGSSPSVAGSLQAGHSLGYQAGAAMREAGASVARSAVPAYRRAAEAAGARWNQ